MKILVLDATPSTVAAFACARAGAGAVDYLPKSVPVDEVIARLTGTASPTESDTRRTRSLAEMQWEHIQRVLRDNDWNVTAAARELGMLRQSLQRKLRDMK